MKLTFLRTVLSTVLLGGMSMVTSVAQGTWGASSYFNFTYAAIPDWTTFPAAVTFKAVVDADTLVFGGCDVTGPTRVKGGYTGAVRAQSVELPKYNSLGYLSFYVHNGSSGTARNIYLRIWDEVTSTWVTVETISVGGNVDQRIVASSVLSKKAVKVRIDSDGKYFWFHQMEAWSSKLATTDVNAAPRILSVSPMGGTELSASGTVKIQFDELVKMGTGSVSFSGATVAPSFVGNTLQVTYSNLSKALDTLVVPATFVQNKASIAFGKDTSVMYTRDVTDPSFVSVSPVDGSKIHINDIAGKLILTFDENIVMGTGTISFGPATLTPTVVGKTLVIGYSGLAYSTAYTLTIPANTIKDISGNTYKSAISIAYTTNDKDATAPTLTAQSIANGATAVPIGGSIALTFSEIVRVLQVGEVKLNGTPVTLSFNGSVAGINYTNLEYSTLYTLEIPAGAIGDTTGNAYAGSTFTFTTKAFATKGFDIIVAKDGSGDFSTIGAAITQVPDNSTQRIFVFVKNGVYNEKVLIPASKQNLSLIGQDSAKTIITYNDYAGGAGGTDLSYTIDIKAPGFYAENITFRNTWPTTGGSTNQAVALMTEGDQQVFKNCRAYSFQDTHYPKQPNTRQYYLNCLIEGATDFMFGAATAYFESSAINCVNGGQYITAPSGTPREFGLVYNNCTITANANVAAQTYYLGRPWKDLGKTVWLNTKMGPHIRDIGWAVWATAGDDADNHLTGFYAEYNSMNLAGVAINPTRAAWGQKLTATQAARYNIDNVFNYGAGSNSWNPLPYSTAPAAPTNVAQSGNDLSWAAPKYAVAYVISRNDTVIGTTTATSYTATGNPSAVYKVKAVNEYGAQSVASSFTTSTSDKSFQLVGKLYPNPFSDMILLQSSDQMKSVEFFNADGKSVKQTAATAIIKTEDLKSGFYTVKVTMQNDASYVLKMIKR